MEEIDLLELLKKWGKVLYKNKWWILGITMLVAVLSFVFTLPSINKPLQEIRATTYVVDFHKSTGINQQDFVKKYFLSSEFKNNILEIYGDEVDSETSLNVKNFNKRIQVSVSKTDISFVLRHESAEKAAQIINTATNLLNTKLNDFISVYLKSELTKKDSLIKLQQQQIDSIKNKIIQFSIENNILVNTNVNQAITESYVSSSNKKGTERLFEIAQEESATLFVLQKDLEQRIILQNQLIEDRNKVLVEMTVEKEFIMILSAPNIKMAKDFPNRLKVISLSILLALFISSLFFLKKKI